MWYLYLSLSAACLAAAYGLVLVAANRSCREEMRLRHLLVLEHRVPSAWERHE